MFEVVNLTQKYFYGAKAVNDVSFALNDDEKLALFAKEGGGKTSLLKCIAGLYPRDTGKIIVNGREISESKPKDRGVRLIYNADEAFFRYRTAKYNLEYSLKIRKTPQSDISETINIVAEKFGLTPFLSEPVYRLYPEIKIRLALARGMLRDENVTLIDNVFSTLTGTQRKELFEELLPAVYEITGNVLFATDDSYEAMSYGDKLAVLSHGKLVDFGNHSSVFCSPENFLTDKTFRDDKVFGIAEVKNGRVSFYGFDMNIGDYNKDEVLFSFVPRVAVKNDICNVKRFLELSDGGARIITERGDVFIFTKDDWDKYVSVDTNTIRLYDTAYENLLTNIAD